MPVLRFLPESMPGTPSSSWKVHPLYGNHPQRYTPWNVHHLCWHLVVATEAGGSHPTGILSNIIFSTLFSSTHAGHTQMEQECIPVGCVLPACCPYLPACTVQGVSATGGLLPGGCLLPREVPATGGGVCYQGVSAPRGWGVSYRGMVSATRGGGGIPDMHWGRPPPWTEWQTGAKILPCPKLHLWAVITLCTPLRLSRTGASFGMYCATKGAYRKGAYKFTFARVG